MWFIFEKSDLQQNGNFYGLTKQIFKLLAFHFVYVSWSSKQLTQTALPMKIPSRFSGA
jgi:hypothetical protein